MNKIVVTGATSMMGVALINECIKCNTKVLAIVRENSPNLYRIPKSNLIEIHQCNMNKLGDHLFPEGSYDIFYHFAWEHTDRKNRDNAILQNSNITYTLDAVRLAKRLGCNTFIGAGSQAEYGRVSNRISPSTPTNPETAYGIAKYAAGKLSEVLCRDLHIGHIWTRIFSVYGPYDNDNTLIMYAINKFMNNESTQFTKAEQLWDYLYSADAARAFYLIGQKGKNGGCYCIGSGEVHPLYEYINNIRNLINEDINIGFGEKKYAENEVMHLCADISSLVNDTEFMPRYSFTNGICETIEWYKNNKKQ